MLAQRGPRGYPALMLQLLLSCQTPPPAAMPIHVGSEDTATVGVSEGCPQVTFTNTAGAVTDMTTTFTQGTPTTITDDGTLLFCPGDWFVRLTATGSLSILGAGREETTLSGGEQGTVLAVSGGALTVEGVTIDRGRALGAGNKAQGGGVYCDDGASVRLSAVDFTNNHAFDGGAIFAIDDCAVTATDVSFVDNTADDDGGTICAWFGGSITLSGVSITGSTARDGGGIFVYQGALSLDGSTLSDNSASTNGGAILSYQSDLTISDTTLQGNQAQGGGAILSAGDAVLSSVTFANNQAEDGGGAMLAYTSTTTTGTDCRFEGNSPNDISTTGGSYSFEALVSFYCDDLGCVLAD
ncbi:MAG: putative outer membrane repeat protein [Myxococcota bacterium]|jgi:predicted outer membrane repeat protein